MFPCGNRLFQRKSKKSDYIAYHCAHNLLVVDWFRMPSAFAIYLAEQEFPLWLDIIREAGKNEWQEDRFSPYIQCQ